VGIRVFIHPPGKEKFREGSLGDGLGAGVDRSLTILTTARTLETVERNTATSCVV
jgi:hypothetical protein